MERVVYYQGFFCLILFLRAELVKATEHYPSWNQGEWKLGTLNRMLACCPGWPLSLTRPGVLSWPATAMTSWPPKATSTTSCLSWCFKGLSELSAGASFLQPYPPPTPREQGVSSHCDAILQGSQSLLDQDLLLLFLRVFLFSLIFILSFQSLVNSWPLFRICF